MQAIRTVEFYCDTCNGLMDELPFAFEVYCDNFDCPEYHTYYQYA